MFDKFLIANRSEVSCCFIKTACRIGVVTVEVEADTRVPHVDGR